MVKACLPHTPQETLTDRIGSGSMIRRFEYLNSTCRRHSGKTRPKFAIVITDQILWCLPIWGGFTQLLRYPGIGRRSYHSDMDHPPCLELDEEEREERSKEEIAHLQEIAGPDICCVIVQKGSPPLSSRLQEANVPHVFLNGPLAHLSVQFQ